MTDEAWAGLCDAYGRHKLNGPEQAAALTEGGRARAAEAAMHDALMKAQWAFRHRCNGCDCQRVAAEAVDAALEAHEVGNG